MEQIKQSQKKEKIFLWQIGVVVLSILMYLAVKMSSPEYANLLISPILASVYFLIIKLIYNHLKLSWILAGTITIVFTTDYLIPLIFLDSFGMEYLIVLIKNTPIILIISVIEVIAEEELEIWES